ncbi:MAG: NAD(P)/FAD-dependent oxidoreductase [Pseudomonadota bacterium]|nr:NAD(P)/FAD-dependent oxidoreductase [Pseudomonadota bacterium]
MNTRKPLGIAIIGAGASGIMAAIKLREAGHGDVTIFEKASDLGGTWRDNRYPGITCDVPSHAYRYSFAPNPDWSRVCSPGAEILEYVRGTAAAHGVDGLIRYESEIVAADWRDGRWHLESVQGDEGAFDVVITATGVLHHPVYPDIAGLEDFGGRMFHTARWPDDVDLKGKRVGIIGTGSTAIQITGAIVGKVAHLSLFQRTAQWVLPLPNRDYEEAEKALFRADPSLVDAEYVRLTTRMNTTFSAAVVGENPKAYDQIVTACEEHLATVRDPDLRRRLTPDYKVGCKRLVMSGDFYEAIQQPNATLVTDRIERVTASGIRTADGKVHELDVLVLATGFDTHRFFRPMRVSGPGGRSLDQAWSAGNQGYLTVSIPEFPNWFMIGGPTSPIGNFSWLLTAETQFAYIAQLIERIAEPGVQAVAPKRAAAETFNRNVRERLPQTVWATGCSSWYIDPAGNIASWPWTFDRFQDDLKAPDWSDFEVA